jgi:hypothetical protein
MGGGSSCDVWALFIWWLIRVPRVYPEEEVKEARKTSQESSNGQNWSRTWGHFDGIT